MSEWGHDFRPDYLRLRGVIDRLGSPTVMACTATATEQVAEEIRERLGLRDPFVVRSGFDRPNLSFDVVPLEGKGSKARKQMMLSAALADPANRPSIVYCGTRKDVEEVTERLRADGRAGGRLPRRDGRGRARLRPAPLHGGRRGRRRRHERVRDGRRQGGRALGDPLGDPEERRGLLPGGRPRRARRRARPGDPARDARRPRAAGQLHRARRRRGGRGARLCAPAAGRPATATPS